ncbi:MAG: aminofutalosine synthase MqnE [Firmicutes bacterium]|nr:aminofutalosine synthase MqnE [Bacillota bacterium]
MSVPKSYETIADKVLSGVRLSRQDGLQLFECSDLLFLGQLARHVKRQKTGNRAFFNVNRHINLTNVCVSRCKFCAFSKSPGEDGAYTMTPDEAVRAAIESSPQGMTELHVVNGLHPELPFEYYVEVIRRLRQALPSVHIQAFTAVEIDYFSEISGLGPREVLTRLKEAGLGSLPGGGAEVFSPRLREVLCSRKASGERWLEVMRIAHSLGLRSNATMLYGHLETAPERVDHLLALRELQHETGGFQSFIPLRFHPANTALAHIPQADAVTDLRVIALSRLLLDNFAHVKAFWIMLGVRMAQLSLEFGVDDLDGTVVEEKIIHAAGAQTDQGISKDELIRLIRDAGLVPVERDTLYNVIKVYDGMIA